MLDHGISRVNNILLRQIQHLEKTDHEISRVNCIIRYDYFRLYQCVWTESINAIAVCIPLEEQAQLGIHIYPHTNHISMA